MKWQHRQIGCRPALWIAFGLGAGLVPKAPGTVGTVSAIPLIILLSQLPIGLQLVLWMAFFLLGCKICQMAADWLDEPDPAAVVWDEVTGFCIAMAFVPVTWLTLAVAFVLFRLADIFKPWPISWFDRRVIGGLGIMLDDVVAGIMTAIVVHVMIDAQLLVT